MAIPPISGAPAARPAVAVEGASSRSFGAALEARAARPFPPPATAAPESPAVALDALKAVERAQRRLDFVLDAARRGRTFTAQELLSLQAQAYRCAQTLDVTARAIEHGARA